MALPETRTKIFLGRKNKIVCHQERKNLLLKISLRRRASAYTGLYRIASSTFFALGLVGACSGGPRNPGKKVEIWKIIREIIKIIENNQKLFKNYLLSKQKVSKGEVARTRTRLSWRRLFGEIEKEILRSLLAL